MAEFKFKITDLLLYTAYFAVAAWLYSLGVELGLLVWIGAIFVWLITRIKSNHQIQA